MFLIFNGKNGKLKYLNKGVKETIRDLRKSFKKWQLCPRE